MSLLLAAHLLTGEVTFYGPGVMDRVYANRLAMHHVAPCPACIGMVALADCRLVGRRVTLTRPGQAPDGMYLVADCGTFRTPNRVAEVDWLTAQRWQMRGPVQDVTVRVLPVRIRRSGVEHY